MQSVPKKDQIDNFINTSNGGNRKWNKNNVAIHRKYAVIFPLKICAIHFQKEAMSNAADKNSQCLPPLTLETVKRSSLVVYPRGMG